MPSVKRKLSAKPHCYIDRATGDPRWERLSGDRLLAFLYSEVREHAPSLFRAATSSRASWLIGYLLFDHPITSRFLGPRFIRKSGIRLDECVHAPGWYDTPRRIFERRIRYWEVRPMDTDSRSVSAPADSRMLLGSLRDGSLLCLKGKLFELEELLGPRARRWIECFREGDCAVFRLTPDKYHYNHAPVSGAVVDFYEVDGAHHSCNPSALVSLVTPFSKNRRVVTIIDTDLAGSSGLGKVAMIEVVALGIGEIRQCYSDIGYENPVPVEPGLFLRRGAPKSLFRPGSSTTVLLFERGRAAFANDLRGNQRISRPLGRLSEGFDSALMETEVRVRSTIGAGVPPE